MSNEINNKKILVIEEVEDEKSLRDVLHDKFVREGFSVLEAKDGEEGLATALRERPDLILLDIVMPKMDGLTMMKKLREANEWGKHVPIFVVSNTASSNNVQSYMRLGINKYYVKAEHRLDEIINEIKSFLNNPEE